MSIFRSKIEKMKGANAMSNALVFSIEEFSVFDGPGIRTSVFLMGCPLRCEWCHNPEGQSFENFILRSPNGCLKCGNCLGCYVVPDPVCRHSECGAAAVLSRRRA